MTAPVLPPSAVALTTHTPGVYVESQVGTHLALPRADMERLLALVDAALAWERANDGWVEPDAGSTVPSERLKAAAEKYRRALAPEGGSDA